MEELDAHFRRYLGRLAGIRKFSGAPEGLDVEFDLLTFEPGEGGFVPVISRGLSSHVLSMGVARNTRVELLMLVPETLSELAESRICDIALDVFRSHRAPGRSQVLDQRGEVFPDSDMNALMSVAPVYQGSGFFVLDTSAERILFPWLMPITAAEAEFVELNGSDAFEAVLEESNVDMRNPYRESLC
ncbi:suppressor of fused domain protein [Leifsonia sp. NPDC058230]|uniref:suppressor of fused domain protein n=1 Tax=Leifsonia sp. NPDC058230 TaxID=3346391 RepID=UPI0036DF747D